MMWVTSPFDASLLQAVEQAVATVMPAFQEPVRRFILFSLSGEVPLPWQSSLSCFQQAGCLSDAISLDANSLILASSH